MIVNTGKYLSERDNKRAKAIHAQIGGPASGMVITDRSSWPEGATCPRTEGEIAQKRFHDFINAAAVAAGLEAAERFIDEDGDDAINNYGLDFRTGEILSWDRHAKRTG